VGSLRNKRAFPKTRGPLTYSRDSAGSRKTCARHAIAARRSDPWFASRASQAESRALADWPFSAGAQLAPHQLMNERSSLSRVAVSVASLLLVARLAAACGPITPALAPSGAPLSINGTVVGVDQRSPSEQLAGGLRVTLQPEGQPKVLVELAPGWFLDQHGLRFSERDRLSIEGTSRAGDPVVVATRVTKGTTSVTLRDPAGHPLWDSPDAGP